MAENKTQPTRASVGKFVAAVPDPVRRADARALIALMGAVSGETATLWGPSIIGFGSHHYVYDSGREGDMPMVCFSPRKPATVLYLATKSAKAKALLAKLGSCKVSGACVHVRKLADVDSAVLEKLIALTIAEKRAK
ncbi:MAG: DUF1801 domain-containing protein [Rhizomicrobium sp.]